MPPRRRPALLADGGLESRLAQHQSQVPRYPGCIARSPSAKATARITLSFPKVLKNRANCSHPSQKRDLFSVREKGCDVSEYSGNLEVAALKFLAKPNRGIRSRSVWLVGKLRCREGYVRTRAFSTEKCKVVLGVRAKP